MNLIKFLFSKPFFKNLIAAFFLILLIVFGLKIYLNIYTHHNEYYSVPGLIGKSFEQAKKILQKKNLKISIIDTVEYNPKFPKFSIVEQNPRKNDQVKKERTIYVKINNDSYPTVKFPNIFGKTKRQAINMLKSAGFQIGKISTQPYFAEVVLYAFHKNDTLNKKSKLPKNSKINLIIGDGKRPVESNTENKENQVDNNIQNILNNVLGN